MAKIKIRENKKGIVFQIKVYDHRLKNSEVSMTWKPDENMTLRQAKKEAERQAIKFEDDIKKKLDEGVNNGVSLNIKFKDLAEKWFATREELQDLKPSTFERYKGFKERTYKALGNTRVVEVTSGQIQEFITGLSKDGVNQTTGGGLSTKTQKHYITFVSDIMNYAIFYGLRANNPCKGVKPKKTQAKEKEVYTLEEVQAIIAMLEKDNVPIQYRALFNILAYTGMRRAEVLGLEWKDIDLKEGIVKISRTSNYRNKSTGTYTDTPKTEKSVRTVNIPKSLSSILVDLYSYQTQEQGKAGDQWHDTDRLFTQWNGEPIHPNTPYTWLKRACERENLSFKGLHSFRHALATQAIVGAKIDISTVSRMLGHSQTSTTLNIYTHEIESVKKAGFNEISNIYSSH